MLEVTIYPGFLSGEVQIPASKSVTHRAVICAGLSEGVSTIFNAGESRDIEATCRAMASLGAEVCKTEAGLSLKGLAFPELKNPHINCCESGSTLRFITPVAALTGKPAVFYGEGRLVERSLAPYFDIFDIHGIKYKTDSGKLPLHLNGKLTPGEYKIPGNISSQFISGLMFALPILDGDSEIRVTTELESRPYIDLTMETLKAFGVNVENSHYRTFIIKGRQKYRAVNYTVPGDFSQAAFWLAAGALGSEVTCRGLDLNSLQGDRVITDIIGEMNGRIIKAADSIKAIPADTKGTVIDASQCPDLVPVLAVLGALSEGRTEIVNASRLRLKESDRLRAVSSELGRLGAMIYEKQEGLVIDGGRKLRGGRVRSWNDHRIAMALAVAASRCEEPVIISNAECVSKSYPNFWEHYKALGGKIDERNLG